MSSLSRPRGRNRPVAETPYRDLDIKRIDCPAGDHTAKLSMGSIAAHDADHGVICEYSGLPYRPDQADKEAEILRAMFGD